MSCCGEHQLMATSSSYILNMWTSSPYLTTLLLGPPLLALLLVYPALLLLTPKETPLPPSAYQFTTSADESKHALPSLAHIDANDEAVQLSIVIPAYNEQDRLPDMLKEAAAHLAALQAGKKTLSGQLTSSKSNGKAHSNAVHHALSSPLHSFEILIVDDGSRDATAKVALQFAKDSNLEDAVRLVRLGRNCGKGKAVRHGVLHSRGALIAFCDADGATRFSDLSSLANEMRRIVTPAGHGIVCGSRAHLVGSEAVIKRSFVRNFLMHSFHFILSLLMRPPNPLAYVQARTPSFLSLTSTGSRTSLPTQPPVRDTQCGFKLFTRASAQAVFPLAHIDRWIFDVELLLLAEKASYATLRQSAAAATSTTTMEDDDATPSDPLLQLPLPIAEVAVEWREVEGSKIDILKDSIKMGIDLLVIRLNYALGRWKSPGVLPGGATVARQEGDAGACCS